MALEWLKPILGESYTEEVEQKIADEIGKGFIARKDFNEAGEAKKALEKQVAARDKQLEELKKASGSTEELAQKIEKLQQENREAAEAREALEKKHKEELADRDFDALLTGELTAAKAKSPKALKALLDIDALKKSKDQTTDIKAAIAEVQKAEGYLFESDEPHKNPVGPTEYKATPGDATTAMLRRIADLPAEKKGD